MKIKSINGTSLDGLLLACIRLLTTVLGILSTMLLSRSLSLLEYGTYSQANLVISLGTSFSILGLTDGTLYFFNKAKNEEEARCSLNTIFAIQVGIGVLLGIAIVFCRSWIIAYYGNPNLAGLFIYIAFRPLLNNLISMLQTLQVSIGRAKAIAVRNIIIAVAKICSIYFAVVIGNDIKFIFIILLVLDAITVLYFWITFEKDKFPIQVWKADTGKIIEIIKFCVPMGIYILTNSLSRDIDKVCIGRLAGTEMLAIYTNCSTVLPVDIISSAFLTVVVPIMTRLVSNKQLKEGRELFSQYIQLGYFTTVTFSAVLFTLSREVICFLYGEKYLGGQVVFLMYTIVSGLRFASLSLVLSANGDTKKLMNISIIGLVANLFLNIVLYYVIGFIGPAVATVIITVATTIILFKYSVRILNCTFNDVICFKQLIKYLVEVIAASILIRACANVLDGILPEIVVLIISGVAICLLIFGFNIRTIFGLFKGINKFK